MCVGAMRVASRASFVLFVLIRRSLALRLLTRTQFGRRPHSPLVLTRATEHVCAVGRSPGLPVTQESKHVFAFSPLERQTLTYLPILVMKWGVKPANPGIQRCESAPDSHRSGFPDSGVQLRVWKGGGRKRQAFRIYIIREGDCRPFALSMAPHGGRRLRWVPPARPMAGDGVAHHHLPSS